MGFRLRGVLPLLLVLAWGVAALALVAFALAQPHRDAGLAALSGLACLVLSVLVWKPGPKPWGSLPLIALSLVPLLMAMWWGSPWAPFVALPAIALLALEPSLRKPALPREAGRTALVLLVAYLALAPPLDALVFGPPEPPPSQVEAIALGEPRAQRLAGGAGAVWEQAARGPGAEVGVVRATLASSEDPRAALREGYAPGREEGAVVFWPFPFFARSEDRRAEAQDLDGEWVRTAVVQQNMTVFFMIPFPMSEGHRQLLLLRPVAHPVTPSLLPPFGLAWTQYAGFHLYEEGDNAAALRAVDGNVSVAGQSLELPAEAYDDLDVGPLRPTPGLESLVALAALGVSAWIRRR